VISSIIRLFLDRVPVHQNEFLTETTKCELQELLLSTKPDLIVLSSPRLAVIVPFLKSTSSAKIVVDTHDVHVQRCQSIYDVLSPLDILERFKQSLLVRSYGIIEKEIYRIVDVAWALKQEDKLLLESFGSVPQVDIVPNVVDPELMRDMSGSDLDAPSDSLSSVFIGDYSYKPNEQCALALMNWFASEQLGRIGSKLFLIGVNPTEDMRSAASRLPDVEVTGAVDDLQDYYRPFDTLFLAPLRAGGGVKRKIIEAMALGCPVVTTEVGAEGLDLVDGLTAEVCSLDNFPERIIALAEDRPKRIKLARNAQSHINSSFGYETLRAAVRASLTRLLDSGSKQ
jgi:glycosyltransferase involved in cell wall biosynthesis